MAAKLTRLTQNSDTTARSGRELYHLQFSLQGASPETFGYTLLSSYMELFGRVAKKMPRQETDKLRNGTQEEKNS
jgi:hypothetical protein